ncbi:MAG TPA: VOC family protein [Pirellulales bacterium]|jgi:catechol 2,3-dioxygenase-like lactoylglutathione lyase family enzyme|nr:VOC family protein [Pirellulales bacterium]
MILHFTLATRDVQRTSDFFVRTLGWRPIQRPGNVQVPAAWLEIGPGQELHLVQVEDFEPSPHEGEYARHCAVSYPLAGFADLKVRLKQAGAEIIPADRATPFERFFFRDPNGYVFEVVEARTVAETESFQGLRPSVAR